MGPSIEGFVTVLTSLFSANHRKLPVNQALLVIGTISVISPLLLRGRIQRESSHGRSGFSGAWFTLAETLLHSQTHSPELFPTGCPEIRLQDMFDVASILGGPDLDDESALHPDNAALATPPRLLLTPHVYCQFCSSPGKKHPLKTRRADKKEVRAVAFTTG